MPMNERILHLAAYDMRDDGRRRQALHAVKCFASSGQKPVFERFLSEGKRLRILIGRIEAGTLPTSGQP